LTADSCAKQTAVAKPIDWEIALATFAYSDCFPVMRALAVASVLG
jgi:hypothetical protein